MKTHEWDCPIDSYTTVMADRQKYLDDDYIYIYIYIYVYIYILFFVLFTLFLSHHSVSLSLSLYFFCSFSVLFFQSHCDSENSFLLNMYPEMCT